MISCHWPECVSKLNMKMAWYVGNIFPAGITLMKDFNLPTLELKLCIVHIKSCIVNDIKVNEFKCHFPASGINDMYCNS